jgi:2',3'-cyclic-nucleotide 2'-phosphodiesterase (5'-nucleotidase family)
MLMAFPAHAFIPIATLLALLAPVRPPDAATGKHPDQLVILSTTDVKGKISPCGCHIPKGGLPRQASFADSLRAEYANVVVVDNGGYFPEDALHLGFASFLMEQMSALGVTAVGLGDRDLKFGLRFLLAEQKRTRLPIVCANLMDRATRRTVVPASLIRPVGAAKVGYFGLVSDKVDLGPARDSLAVQDPTVAAKRTIAELKARGATVIVLLSQLGKVESEDLVSQVDGVDAVIVGRNVPMLQKGRLIKSTIACYGGEQGQHFGRTLITLDARGQPMQRENDVFVLGPEVGERPDLQKLVKAFEDAFNEQQRKADMIHKVEGATADNKDAPDRFVGSEVCQRCHVEEAKQWLTTRHAHAWQTLVDEKKEATPDCVPCHTVGYQKPGGFEGEHVASLVNVGCENCHGMGSRHDSLAAANTQVAEATCRTCHDATTSPDFDFAKYRPHVVHDFAGVLPELPKRQTSMMKSGTH